RRPRAAPAPAPPRREGHARRPPRHRRGDRRAAGPTPSLDGRAPRSPRAARPGPPRDHGGGPPPDPRRDPPRGRRPPQRPHRRAQAGAPAPRADPRHRASESGRLMAGWFDRVFPDEPPTTTGDFNATRRVIPISVMAIGIGILSGLVAWA